MNEVTVMAMIDLLNDKNNELDRLRAEVASLKEERDMLESGFNLQPKGKTFTEAYKDLTEQLTAAKEYADRLREALEAQKFEGNITQLHSALALPKPWEPN